MARTARAAVGGMLYHVMNRGNARGTVFHEPCDYAAFLGLLADAAERPRAARLLGYCLMPNHFHLLLWPKGDGDLSRYMQWLLTAHVRRYHRHYRSSGHVWQGRFKAFPIQKDEHLLAVWRYIERNPLRANLVRRSAEWPWSSLGEGTASDGRRPPLAPSPIDRPTPWERWVDRDLLEPEVDRIRGSIARGTPYGTPVWTKRIANRLGLLPSLRPLGRPPNRITRGKK